MTQPIFIDNTQVSAFRKKIKPIRVTEQEDAAIEELLQRNAHRFGGRAPNFSQYVRSLLADEAKKEGLSKTEEKVTP